MATKPLLALPPFRESVGSPELVKVFDRLRYGPLSEQDELGEFLWFAREYPRVYRHHIDHAEHRLASIYAAYQWFHDDAVVQVAARTQEEIEPGVRQSVEIYARGTRPGTYAVYWDFESYLSAVSSSLDILARIVGTAYRKVTPSTFNKFRKTAPADDLRSIFEHAQARWVRRMKEYRDCFVHYTPVDTLLMMGLLEYPKHYEIRARLPVNPQIREILGFRYSRRVELLRYALAVWRHLHSFDRALARNIWRRYKAGTYPVRTTNLFFVGNRNTPKSDAGVSDAGASDA